ncbi:MAG: hypothetical protein HQK79_20230 [Desulfobacterales bacterium]|nr:hypothetical protein [Desulfobacterales bacterium]
MQIQKYETSDLDPLIAEATANQTIEEWTTKLLASIKSILKNNLSRYRSFGPYWWILKQMYVKRNDYSFGEYLDAEWLRLMDYGNENYNLAAAFAYEENAFNLGLMDYPFHTLEDEEGNPIEFISADEEMEAKSY